MPINLLYVPTDMFPLKRQYGENGAFMVNMCVTLQNSSSFQNTNYKGVGLGWVGLDVSSIRWWWYS